MQFCVKVPVIYALVDLPVNGNGHKCEYADSHREDGNEVVHFAVESTKRPIRIQHVYKIENNVQCWNHYVGQTEVHQEIIGHSSLWK